MQEKSKRFIAMVLMISMVLSILAPLDVNAVRIDEYYKPFLKRLEIETGKTWLRPEPIITATLPDGSVTSVGPRDTYSNDGNQWIESIFNVDEPHIKVPVGTKINLDSIESTVGSGSKIDGWDWQIYGQQNKDGTYDDKPQLTSGKTTSFTPTNPGTYGIYLNVKDDYVLSSHANSNMGYTNWSDLGNFKAHHKDGTRIIKNGDDELNIKDWYFTMMVIEVENAIDIKAVTLKPIPEVVTGRQVVFSATYNIHDVAESDKADLLYRDYEVVIQSPLLPNGMETGTVNFNGNTVVTKTWTVEVPTLPCAIGPNGEPLGYNDQEVLEFSVETWINHPDVTEREKDKDIPNVRNRRKL